MKERVYINRVAVDYQNLYTRAKDYFHRHGVDIDFEFIPYDYKPLSARVVQFPQGQRVILEPTMSQVLPLDPAYDINSFVFNGREFPPPNIPNGYCYMVEKQPFIDIETDPLNPPNLDYVTICHEHMHALTYLANLKGFPVQDQMDTYYNNMELESADSNFGRQWGLLSKYVASLQTNPIVFIDRNKDDGKEITGILSTNGFSCSTLELPFKNNQPDVSSIPLGKYHCVWGYMNDLKEWHYELQNVPGRTGIFIHEGNFNTNTQGCILLGSSFKDINGDKELDVIDSRITLQKFEDLMNGKPFDIEIRIAAIPSSYPTLRFGSKGPAVEDLQRKLNLKRNCNLGVDGDFGPSTQKQVVAFQAANRLKGDGVVGPATWAKLNI